MKKSVWIALALMLVCILSFSACDQGDTPPANDDVCQHTFGEWNTTKQATCKDEGELVRICSKCSTEEKTTVSKTNTHTYDDNNDKECNVCGFIRDVDCKHTDTIIVSAVEPTCVTNGLTEGTKCSLCGETLVSQTIINPLDHSFTNYVSDGNATYESDGTKTAACDRDGCNATDRKTDIGSKLERLTVQFMADGNVISTQTFDPSNNNVTIPDCPVKNGFVGKWENFVLGEKSIVVNALYIKQEVWDGTSISEGFWDGDGSEVAPFTIATPQQLHYFEASVNAGTSYEGKYIKLCGDIDLGGHEWKPIGFGDATYDYRFKGVFDGSCYTIKNYQISEINDSYFSNESKIAQIGLFGATYNATIKNLIISNFNIDVVTNQSSCDVYMFVGGLVGNGASCTIKECSVEGDLSANATVSYYYVARVHIGGVAGNMTGIVSDTIAKGNISSSTNYSYGGGICGSGSPAIQYCKFNGSVKSMTEAGGIIGSASNNTIKYCSAKVALQGGTYCGGIVGLQSNTTVTACDATTHVTSISSYVGGISGYLSKETDSINNSSSYIYANKATTSNNIALYYGGIAGYVKEGMITNAISKGLINISTSEQYAYAYVGGIAGFTKGTSSSSPIKIENCIVWCELNASTASNLDVGKVYDSSLCSISNVCEGTINIEKTLIESLNFLVYEGKNEIATNKVWVWDEVNNQIYLFIDEFTPTHYTVKHFIESLDGSYQLLETEEVRCKSGIIVSPIPRNIEGFITPIQQTVWVAEDGSTIIEYKYIRKSYQINLCSNNGSKTTISLKYQEVLNTSTWAKREGYTFGGWFYDADLTEEFAMTQMLHVNESITLYAWWKEENKPTDFAYNVYDSLGYVSISSYIGEDNSIVVPSYIQGIPVKQISSYAFKDHTELVSLVLPSTVTTINTSILQGCNNIVSLTVPFVGKNSTPQYTYLDTNYILGYFFGIQEIKDGQAAPEGWIKQGSIIKSIYEYGVYSNIPSSLSSVTLTGGTAINAHAFYNCANIKSFILNDDITIIGEYAFYQSGLNGSLYLPKLQTICEYAFDNTNLSYMHIPVTVTSIASYAFIGSDGLVISCEATTKPTYWQQDWDYSVSKLYWGVTENSAELSFFYTNQGYVVDKYNGDAEVIIVPSTYDDGKNGIAPVIGIHDYAFYQSDIVAIIIPNTINYIGESAFKECDKLVAVILDDGLVNIGNNAFRDCSVLQSVAIPTTVTTIGERAFQDAGIKTLNILTNSADMGAWVFYSCNDLVNVTIAEGTTQIYHGQFEQCNSIEKIVLPDTMAILDYDAFMNCSSLKTIIIPKTVTEIRDWAFHECPESLVISYVGTESDWHSIIIGTNNDILYSCTINTIE